jgi:hypothetical protein
VYDLDESETTETLDAPRYGVDYTIPFGLVARVVLPPPEAGEEVGAQVTLHSGEQLEFERKGDLGARNAGLLVFVEGAADPEYVAWAEVEQVTFEPVAADPPVGGLPTPQTLPAATSTTTSEP